MSQCKIAISAVILDLDGTLVDSTEAYIDAAETAFTELGCNTFDPGTVKEIPRRFELGLPLRDLLQGLEEEEFRKTYLKAFYEAASRKSRPFPRVAATLARLSEKTRLALVTRRHVPQKALLKQLETLKMKEYFRLVVTGIDEAHPKPSPDAFFKCARELDVTIRDCAVVGDSVVDVQAGKKAHARTVAVLSGIFSLKELKVENPDLILKNVSELPDLIE